MQNLIGKTDHVRFCCELPSGLGSQAERALSANSVSDFEKKIEAQQSTEIMVIK
jgi:hypothetical protein